MVPQAGAPLELQRRCPRYHFESDERYRLYRPRRVIRTGAPRRTPGCAGPRSVITCDGAAASPAVVKPVDAGHAAAALCDETPATTCRSQRGSAVTSVSSL